MIHGHMGLWNSYHHSKPLRGLLSFLEMQQYFELGSYINTYQPENRSLGHVTCSYVGNKHWLLLIRGNHMIAGSQPCWLGDQYWDCLQMPRTHLTRADEPSFLSCNCSIPNTRPGWYPADCYWIALRRQNQCSSSYLRLVEWTVQLTPINKKQWGISCFLFLKEEVYDSLSINSNANSVWMTMLLVNARISTQSSNNWSTHIYLFTFHQDCDLREQAIFEVAPRHPPQFIIRRYYADRYLRVTKFITGSLFWGLCFLIYS